MSSSENTSDSEEDEPLVSDQVIGTEAGRVMKLFDSWDVASEWRDDGHARNIYGIPTLTESDSN